MNKERKIDMLLASLARIISDYNEARDFTNPPCVIFLSASEVQTIEQEGNMPTNKVYSDNPLRELIKKVIDVYYKDEEKSWEESWSTDNPVDDVTDIDAIYDATYWPEHIYHTLRMLKQFISED